jgi:hypothetical protein
MEEILASIRQIISEDDDVSDAGSNKADADGADATSEKASEPEASSAPPVEESSAGGEEENAGSGGESEPALADIASSTLDSDSNSRPPAEPAGRGGGIFETMEPSNPEPSDRVSDHSDIVDTGPYENPFDALAAKHSEAEAAEKQAEAPSAPETMAEAHEPEPVPAADPVAAEPAAPEPETPESAVSEPVAEEPQPEIVAEPVVSQPVAEEPAPAPEAVPAPSNVEQESPAMSAPKPVEVENNDSLMSPDEENLISPEKGASVSNAFSTLTHTILSQNARTLDDLVSDMLQPMLKDWLDENLPTLVERLVKQEIDRMARGGRR